MKNEEKKTQKTQLRALLEAGVTAKLNRPQIILNIIPLNATGEIKVVESGIYLYSLHFWRPYFWNEGKSM